MTKGDDGTSADGFDTGGLVHMGSATNETTCVDGEIEVVTLGR